jgi:hypothetical protein
MFRAHGTAGLTSRKSGIEHTGGGERDERGHLNSRQAPSRSVDELEAFQPQGWFSGFAGDTYVSEHRAVDEDGSPPRMARSDPSRTLWR